jgi:hypothetical protein
VISSLAKALSVSADELLGLKKSDTAPAVTPSVQIARRMQKKKASCLGAESHIENHRHVLEGYRIRIERVS